MNGGHELLVVGVDAFAGVRAGILLSQVLDEEHDCRITGLLFGVDPLNNGTIVSGCSP